MVCVCVCVCCWFSLSAQEEHKVAAVGRCRKAWGSALCRLDELIPSIAQAVEQQVQQVSSCCPRLSFSFTAVNSLRQEERWTIQRCRQPGSHLWNCLFTEAVSVELWQENKKKLKQLRNEN